MTKDDPLEGTHLGRFYATCTSCKRGVPHEDMYDGIICNKCQAASRPKNAREPHKTKKTAADYRAYQRNYQRKYNANKRELRKIRKQQLYKKLNDGVHIGRYSMRSRCRKFYCQTPYTGEGLRFLYNLRLDYPDRFGRCRIEPVVYEPNAGNIPPEYEVIEV